LQSRALPVFTRLNVGGGLEVTVNVGKNAPLELRGDDNLFSHVASTVTGGELVLKPDSVFETTQPLRLVVGTERLDAVAVAVGANVTVHGVKADAFDVRVAGAAQLAVDGSSQTLTLTTRNLARCDLTAFSAGTAKVSVSDLSRVKLGYVEKLDATQAGHAVIAYRGTPDVTRHAERPANVGVAN
jgi:hypothetical protein